MERVGEMKFNQIFAGEVNYVVNVAVKAGDYKRGDLLECVATSGSMASAYGQCATAGTAVMANDYVVCAEDKKFEEEANIVAYKEGFFDKGLIMLNGEVANAGAINILRTKKIFLETTK